MGSGTKFNDIQAQDTLNKLYQVDNGINGQNGTQKKLPINEGCQLYSKLGEDIYIAMHESLERNDRKYAIYSEIRDLLFKLWNKYECQIKVGDVSSSKPHFKGDAIHINKERDSKENNWLVSNQAIFHECFHVIDCLCSGSPGDFMSHRYNNNVFTKVISNDVQYVKTLLEAKYEGFRTLPKQQKAFLYDIIGGVLNKEPFKDDSGDRWGHGKDQWLKYGDAGFQKVLASECFANMAAIATSNIDAFTVMVRYLKGSHIQFKKILNEMVIGLEK